MIEKSVAVLTGTYTISTRVAGQGPLVILMHGWPELGLSWRHQISPIVEAGFTVAVPDMRGYGGSSKPKDPSRYGIDAMADDMAAIASALGHQKWISVGHDWGGPVAWRTAMRFPKRVAAVFSMSMPHIGPLPIPMTEALEALFPNQFSYVRYFQEIGPAEAELERNVRYSLKTIYFSLSGDAPKDDFMKPRPLNDLLLPGLTQPPPGPLSFMPDEMLDIYTKAFEEGGFFGPISWYRNFGTDFVESRGYGDAIVHQPAGFICGEKDITLTMVPNCQKLQKSYVSNLIADSVIAGAGHWIQQERPAEVNSILLKFLSDVWPVLS